ncbi:helix-turn-helix transcriptional regulator [Vallicoccus soli]|uniref:helix-turn-helix transcriptional regulator n=1 Tax=Vallicoccus soli TaxID=2339232 RepID=UPI001402F32D|nr:WYL domain-containing protein [Vallicoccus soli]
MSRAGTGASERLARLLALVPYLTARPGARVEDVARTFGITEARLLEDLQLLFVCGLPGHLPDDLIEASFEGGYIHVSNADTIARPLRLGADEAAALLVGLRTLADALGEAGPGGPGGTGDGGRALVDRDALDRTVAKLERAAGDAAALAAHVAVAVETDDDVVPEVRRALAGGRRLHLSYYVPGRDETTERDVEPMRLLIVEGRAYLEAWCRRADGVRLFRLDRVQGLRVLDEPARVPEHAEPRDVGEGLFQPSEADTVVTLELDPPARWVAEYYPCDSVVELGEGRLQVRLRTPDPRWVGRLALRLGGQGRVVDPPGLAEDVRREARAALDAYA